MIRSGWVNTSNPSSRAMPTRVRPATSAVRTANAVGADTPTMIAAPIMPGLLHELDGGPARQYDDARHSRPACPQQCARQFVERIVSSYVFTENEALIRPPKRRSVDRASLLV